MWFSKGSPPQNDLNSGLGIILICQLWMCQSLRHVSFPNSRSCPPKPVKPLGGSRLLKENNRNRGKARAFFTNLPWDTVPVYGSYGIIYYMYMFIYVFIYIYIRIYRSNRWELLVGMFLQRGYAGTVDPKTPVFVKWCWSTIGVLRNSLTVTSRIITLLRLGIPIQTFIWLYIILLMVQKSPNNHLACIKPW